MTYTEAKQMQVKASKLIGEKTQGFDGEIIDIIIEPIDSMQLFRSHYIRGLKAKDFEKTYPTENYSITVVFEVSGRRGFDDISLYADRI